MFKPKTYLDLVMAMKTRAIVTIDTVVGIVNGIAAEDGSGHNWLVTIQPTGDTDSKARRLEGQITVFFRE